MRIETGVTVFVTGGGGGIGLAVARCCAAKGANSILAEVHAERLQATLSAFEGPVLGIVMDIAEPADWARARAEAEARFGAVDVLVNCAAIPPSMKPLIDTDIADFEARIAVNLNGVFYGVRTFGPPMRDRGHGHIANVASDCGLAPMAGLGDYATAKYGVIGLTEILRAELADTGIGVTAVIPGLTRSNMTIGMGMDPRYVGEAIVRGIEANDAYVVTHPQIAAPFERRVEAIRAAIGGPAQPGYVQEPTPWY